MSGSDDVMIIGLGMHRFGRTDGTSGRQMGVHATRRALADAGITWPDVQFAFGGSYASGDADTLVSDLGLTGIPFVNVRNGCGTGGSALISARNAIASGSHDLGLVVGFDKHPRGAFTEDPANLGLGRWYGESGLMVTTQFFAMKIQRYMAQHGITDRTLAKVAAKAFRNAEHNDHAWRRTPMTEEQILTAPMVNPPLTQYMFCSPGEGAVALVLASAERARSLGVTGVRLRSVELRTRRFGSFEVYSPWLSPERAEGPTSEAARAAFESAGIGPDEVDVAQVQDTESGAEIMHLAETGLCKDGEQEQLYATGALEIGGTLPVNTDGGVIANGEPIGATGLRQVHEVVLQLRGAAGVRQVPDSPKVGFTHVYGAPGLSACAVLSV